MRKGSNPGAHNAGGLWIGGGGVGVSEERSENENDSPIKSTSML